MRYEYPVKNLIRADWGIGGNACATSLVVVGKALEQK
jgi:hypothetical protein